MKRRGYPDRRGMGAQSDFIAEPFVPSPQYKEQQNKMMRNLAAAGVRPEQFARMFLLAPAQMTEEIPENQIPGELPSDP